MRGVSTGAVGSANELFFVPGAMNAATERLRAPPLRTDQSRELPTFLSYRELVGERFHFLRRRS